MPCPDNEDSEEELDERELPDESDFNDDDDDETTAACPHCGAEVYQDIERCPECGRYVIDAPTWRKPVWLILAAVVCVIIVLDWVFHG